MNPSSLRGFDHTMNNLQRSVLTALLAWAGVGGIGLGVAALPSILWELSNAVPPPLQTPALLLPFFIWVALFGWAIWRVWQR